MTGAILPKKAWESKNEPNQMFFHSFRMLREEIIPSPPQNIQTEEKPGRKVEEKMIKNHETGKEKRCSGCRDAKEKKVFPALFTVKYERRIAAAMRKKRKQKKLK